MRLVVAPGRHAARLLALEGSTRMLKKCDKDGDDFKGADVNFSLNICNVSFTCCSWTLLELRAS